MINQTSWKKGNHLRLVKPGEGYKATANINMDIKGDIKTDFKADDNSVRIFKEIRKTLIPLGGFALLAVIFGAFKQKA